MENEQNCFQFENRALKPETLILGNADQKRSTGGVNNKKFTFCLSSM